MNSPISLRIKLNLKNIVAAVAMETRMTSIINRTKSTDFFLKRKNSKMPLKNSMLQIEKYP